MRILKLWGPVVLWAGLILVAATDLLSAESTGNLLVMLFGVEIPHWLHVAIRKLAHLTVYGILATLTWRADRRWAVILSVVLAVAVTDESLQSRTAKRTGSPFDVGIDLAGGVIAVAGVKAHGLIGSQAHRRSRSRR